MAVSGFILWRRRKPADALGAPPPPHMPARMGGVVAILLLLATLLPLLAASLVALWLIERLVLPHVPGLARWLGLAKDAAGQVRAGHERKSGPHPASHGPSG